MPNKASEHVDRAHVHVDSILTNKTNLSSTPDINLLLEEALRKIQYLDTNYQKMAQEVEALRLAVTQYEQEKFVYYRTISKLVVRDAIMAAKTKSSFQEVQETQSRHYVALQQHQSDHEKKMNKLKVDVKNKADNKCLISIEESLKALKEILAQHCERMDITDEKFEDFLSRMQMEERNARRQYRPGLSLEKLNEAHHELSREDLKQSLKESDQNISLRQSYDHLTVNRPRFDSGVSVTSSESLQFQLQDECLTSSLPLTSPDSGFNTLAVIQETCDTFAPTNPVVEASQETRSFQLKPYQVPTTLITEVTNDS